MKFEVIFYLVGGQQIRFRCEDFKSSHSGSRLTGWEATGIPPGSTYPHHVPPSAISAVTVRSLQDEGESREATG